MTDDCKEPEPALAVAQDNRPLPYTHYFLSLYSSKLFLPSRAQQVRVYEKRLCPNHPRVRLLILRVSKRFCTISLSLSTLFECEKICETDTADGLPRERILRQRVIVIPDAPLAACAREPLQYPIHRGRCIRCMSSDVLVSGRYP